jgi:CheY-like chemotaxis protein
VRDHETDSRALNILLVDDDEVDVIIVKRAFANARLANKLFVAHDGIEALAMLRGDAMPQTRRIVLLDLEMPRMNGIELLREIRNDAALKGLTVIVMTTSTLDRDRVEAFKLNAAGYIVKPVTFNAFVDAMAMLNKYWTLMEL